MKKQKLKQSAHAALAAVLAAGLLAGCGGQSGTVNDGNGGNGSGSNGANGGEDTPEFVYVAEYIPIKAELENGVNGGIYANGTIYTSSYEKLGARETDQLDPETGEPVIDPETGETLMEDYYGQVLYTLDLEGNLERFPYTPAAPETKEGDVYIYTYMAGLSVADDGTLYLLEETDENWNDAPEGIDQSSEEYWNYQHYEQSYTLKVLSPEGEVRSSADLSALAPGEEEYFYISSFEADNAGNLYLASDQKVYILDQDGTEKGTIEADNWIERIVKIGDDVWCAYYGDSGEVLAKIDPQTKSFGEGQPIQGDLYSMTAGGGDYDLYYTNGINFYGYDLENGESEKLLNWISCDVNPDNGISPIVLDDGRIVRVETEYNESAISNRGGSVGVSMEPTATSQLVILSKQPYDSVPQKEIMTLATQYLNWNVRDTIINFNRNSDKYRIEVRDYSEYNNYDSEDEADWNAGLTKLKTEILSGNVPDILDLNGLPLKQFANKGFLENLYTWIDGDAELSREDLMPSVIKALEINGGLYQTCDGFAVQTVAGARRVVGDKPGWTLAEYRAALAEMPEGCQPFDQYTTRDNMLSTCLALDGDQFVDWGTGACHFDSEGFVELLEFVNSFPEEYNVPEDYEWNEYDEPPARIARGEQMLYTEYLSYLDSLSEVEAIFGGDMTFIGYPTAYGTGNMFNISGGYAMSSKCANKEAAWEFMRQFFTESYQNRYTYRLPTNVNAFNATIKDAMTPQYVTDANGKPVLDENGNKVEIDYGSWSWGGVEVKYHPMTQAEADQIRELIDTTTKINSYDDTIYGIVSEGAAPFFAGQRSAEEVAKQIQSKAMLAINEQL